MHDKSYNKKKRKASQHTTSSTNRSLKSNSLDSTSGSFSCISQNDVSDTNVKLRECKMNAPNKKAIVPVEASGSVKDWNNDVLAGHGDRSSDQKVSSVPEGGVCNGFSENDKKRVPPGASNKMCKLVSLSLTLKLFSVRGLLIEVIVIHDVLF